MFNRFRQDGIRKDREKADDPYIIAYSPVGFQKDKNRILLAHLLPGDALNFPNETLSSYEQVINSYLIKLYIN